MAIRGQWGIGKDQRCSYLPEQTARMELLWVSAIDVPEFDALMDQGYRHFGTQFFRPFCRDCHACVPLRVCTKGFRPSRSVRRVFERAKHLDIQICDPQPSPEAYELYCLHKERFRDTNPDSEPVTYEDFVTAFYHAYPFARTLVIRDGSRLLAVSHFDITASMVSAVYCYYDPREQALSLGRLAVYLEVSLAARCGIPYVHLGYYIAANRHMRYKSGFRPNEVLLGCDEWAPFMDGGNRCVLSPDRLLAGFRPIGKPRWHPCEAAPEPASEGQ